MKITNVNPNIIREPLDVDTRTGKPAKGQELFNGRRNRNKSLSTPQPALFYIS